MDSGASPTIPAKGCGLELAVASALVSLCLLPSAPFDVDGSGPACLDFLNARFIDLAVVRRACATVASLASSSSEFESDRFLAMASLSLLLRSSCLRVWRVSPASSEALDDRNISSRFSASLLVEG